MILWSPLQIAIVQFAKLLTGYFSTKRVGSSNDQYEDIETQPVYEAAHHRFDISQWSKNLYIGRLYVAEDAAPVGVVWEDASQPCDHNSPEEPVETLPDDLIPISEIPPAAADDLPDLN